MLQMQLMLLAAVCRHPASGFGRLGNFQTEGNIKIPPKVLVECQAKRYCGASSQPATIETDPLRGPGCTTDTTLQCFQWDSIRSLHV